MLPGGRLTRSAAPAEDVGKPGVRAGFGSETITFFRSLSAAGFAATAIAYGPARMGFGLFVPEFRSAFSMSTEVVGFVSSLGFFGFFFGLVIAQALLVRRGPEAPVVLGLIAATAGMGIVAAAPSQVVLAAGVALAASSAGFAWTPFNDAVHRKVWDADRPVALSQISTGTSVGIAAAGFAALAMSLTGLSWRICWMVFAVAGVIALIANWAALRRVDKAPGDRRAIAWRALFTAPALPLFLVAFVFGTTSAIYIAFAADHMTQAGGVAGLSRATTPALVFIFYGLFGLAGHLTGQVRNAIGLAWLLRIVMLAGAASGLFAALLPDTWAGLILSAGLQGVHVMMTSAVLAFWSERLFPALPSLGFTVTLLAMATGSIVGPATAGLVSNAVGAGPVFLGSAALLLATAALLRERDLRERPARGAGAQ